MPVKAGDVVGTEPLAGQVDHLAMACDQVTDRQRGELGGHELADRRHRGTRKAFEIARFRLKSASRRRAPA